MFLRKRVRSDSRAGYLSVLRFDGSAEEVIGMTGRHSRPKGPSVQDFAHQAADGDKDAAYEVCLRARPSSIDAMVRIVSPGLMPTRVGFDAACDAFDIWTEKGRP